MKTLIYLILLLLLFTFGGYYLGVLLGFGPYETTTYDLATDTFGTMIKTKEYIIVAIGGDFILSVLMVILGELYLKRWKINYLKKKK